MSIQTQDPTYYKNLNGPELLQIFMALPLTREAKAALLVDKSAHGNPFLEGHNQLRQWFYTMDLSNVKALDPSIVTLIQKDDDLIAKFSGITAIRKGK